MTGQPKYREQSPGRIPVPEDAADSDSSSMDYHAGITKQPQQMLSPSSSSSSIIHAFSNDMAELSAWSDEEYHRSSVRLQSSQEHSRRSSKILVSSHETLEAFEDFDSDLPWQLYKASWSTILCVVGILDIFAYLEPTLRELYDERCSPSGTENNDPGGDVFSDPLLPHEFYIDVDPVAMLPFYCCPTSVTFLNRLRDYKVVIAFVFSLLWFKHSQNKAREEKHREKTKSRSGDDAAMGGGFGVTTSHKPKKTNVDRQYRRRLLFELLLLPLGFYVVVFHVIRGLMRGEWLYRELLIRPHNETVFLTLQDPKKHITIEVSEAHAKMSTAFAIFVYLRHRVRLATSFAWASAIQEMKRNLVRKATRNPMHFIKQLKLIFQYVRWIKYGLPLIIKVAKLWGNALATWKKRKQLTEAEAALVIQRAWRRYYYSLGPVQRAALHLMQQQRAAAMKIQVAYRRVSLRTRVQTLSKKQELVRLEKLRRMHSKDMGHSERRRLYELQDEFLVEAKKTVNQRLLLRPNTKFSVRWNALFVFCVLVEISQHALRPCLRTGNRKYRSLRWFLAESLIPAPVAETPACKNSFRRKKPSAFQRLFYHGDHLEQPTRQEVVSAFLDEIGDFDFVTAGNNETATRESGKTGVVPWRCSKPFSTWRDGYRDVVSLVFHPSPVWEWPACKKEVSLVGRLLSPFRKTVARPLPWYCSEPYSTLHNGYRLAWNFVIDQIHVVLSYICFLDVFVKFFTGDLDSFTGRLKPQPFVKRWIIPGLLLQLLVNPSIEGVSDFFWKVAGFCLGVGPVRVLHWCIAVGVPVGYGLCYFSIRVMARSDTNLAMYAMMLREFMLS